MSSPTSNEDLFGNVIIEFMDFDYNHGTGGSLTPKTIDIWPLINLQRKCPDFRVDTQDLSVKDLELAVEDRRDCPNLERGLVQLCGIEDQEAFYGYMDAAITKLEMTSGDGTLSLTFVMKSDHWKDWMCKWTRAVAYAGTNVTHAELGDAVDTWGGEAGM